MPTYDYECEPCGIEEEHVHSMSESPKIKCSKCGKVMTRLISGGSGAIFKGTGFYETDYKRPEEKAKRKRQNQVKDDE